MKFFFFFLNDIYKLFRGNCPEQKSAITCSERNFIGGGKVWGGGGVECSCVVRG